MERRRGMDARRPPLPPRWPTGGWLAARRGASLGLRVLAAGLLAGCAPTAQFVLRGVNVFQGQDVATVPVVEVDRHGIGFRRIQRMGPDAAGGTVTAVLGQPADRQVSCIPHRLVWRYPIRAWNDMAAAQEVVPAPLLRLRFDAAGLLKDWAFVDRGSGEALPVRESLEDASRWFDALRKGTIAPPRVELERFLIRGRTTQGDVERELGRWQPDLYCGNGGLAPVVRKEKTADGAVWDWYVDRPSPLFIPPGYLVVEFDDLGKLILCHLASTYPGVASGPE